MRILGAILAGGRSTRFGADKAMAIMRDGRTLMEHAAAALAPHASALVICGRPSGLPDRPRPDLGPLGGLNAALHHARSAGFDGVLTSGCDMPSYPAEAPSLLIGPSPAALADQPLIGWWPATLAEALDDHLATDNSRSVRAWLLRVNGRAIDAPGLSPPNINRPEDLSAAH